jgi:hypothetical protein
MTKNCKILLLRKKTSFYFNQIAIVVSLVLHKGRSSYRRRLLPQKRTSSNSYMKFQHLILLCGSFLLSWIQILKYTVPGTDFSQITHTDFYVIKV